MARVREFDESDALAAVEAVFWRQGYAASYADLMAATGLGKGSMYAAFGDKRALFRLALNKYVDRELNLLETVLKGGGSGADRLRAVMQYPVLMAAGQGDVRLGCFLCFSAMDVAPNDPDVAAIVSSAISRIEAGLRASLEAAGAAPTFAPTITAAYFGMQVMARAGAPIETLQAAAEGALGMLDDPADLQ